MDKLTSLNIDWKNVNNYFELVRLIIERKDTLYRMKELIYSENLAYLERESYLPDALKKESRNVKFEFGQDSNFLDDAGLRRADSKEFCFEIDLALSSMFRYRLEKLVIPRKKAI